MQEVCKANPTAVIPDATNCARFYDCREAGLFGVSYRKECHYPDLFSTVTGSCENFTTVACDTRPEPQAPCELMCFGIKSPNFCMYIITSMS